MKLRNVLATFVLSVFVLPLAMAANDSPAGRWTTIDDKTGKERSIVDLTVSGNTLSGRIVKIFPQPGDTGICSKCPGAFKDKPILGMNFVWGLKNEGNGVWSGGSILDPKSGKVYKAKMTLDGNRLNVRGYVGVSILGRTQVWKR